MTKEFASDAMDIYIWHWRMGFTNIKTKDGADLDLSDYENISWDDTSRLGREIVISKSRLGFRKWVWRELVKLHFHTLRRI